MRINNFLKYNKSLLIFFISLIMLLGCETADLNQQVDPNEITPENADPDLLFTNVQLSFRDAVGFNEDNEDGISSRAAEFVRMKHLFGSYASPFSLRASGVDDIWRNLYRECLQDISVMLNVAEERNLRGYQGLAKIIQSYVYVVAVDTWGNVPFSQALNPENFPNPSVDEGQEIYNAILVLLDEAISDLNSSNGILPNTDLFYNGNVENWITLANTLKFKMYAQMRLVGDYRAEIDELISEGLITDLTQDFQFRYSTASTPNESRDPNYVLSYDPDGSDDYMSNYYMNLLLNDKGFNDPRLRYYFYRQSNEVPTGDDLPCETLPGFNFCYLGDFYWGRDHGDDLGVPPDQLRRTTYGLYPIGGAFDADNFVPVTENSGAGGNGIFPFILSSYTKFLLAESALMANTAGDPLALLQDAIQDSMDKVLNFDQSQVDPDYAASQEDVANYIEEVTARYNAASNDEERLDVIMKEYYIALWGNGYEAWNNYRRTGFPSDLSTHVRVPGVFPRTALYPATVINTNSSISQQPITTQVFWDNNPAGFID